jgi:amino acid transporter
VAYGYLGIEATAVAAFEARNIKSIARPSQLVHWVAFLLYFLCTMGIALTVSWTNPRLPLIYGGISGNSNSSDNASPTGPPMSDSAVVLAVYDSNPTLAAFLNGCLIFSILSVANTVLYVASRTLYGLTYHLRGSNMLSHFLKDNLGVVWSSTGVPAMALFVTVFSFYWLPWLTLAESFTIQDVRLSKTHAGFISPFPN